MRLYLVHPKYLDSQGLVGLWRESLLAQRVLLRLKLGESKVGYSYHPSLSKFKSLPVEKWIDSIGFYLQGILTESRNRGYHFNESLIASKSDFHQKIEVSESEVLNELEALKSKLYARNLVGYNNVKDLSIKSLHLHPIFVTK